MKKITVSLLLILMSLNVSFSQIQKYGKISKKALESTSDPIFKDANAIVLFKHRKSKYIFDGNFFLVTKVHERIKLYHKNGFKNATLRIPYFTGGNFDVTISIKATTYNILNGKIIKTKLDKKLIFKKKNTAFLSSKSFTMPALKEGCIVEWEYEIKTPFFTNLNDLVFQLDIPLKYYEAKISIPQYFIYKTKVSKYYPISIQKYKDNRSINYSSHKSNLEFIENVHEVKLNNIKALKNEPFINNLNNYRGKVEFELLGVDLPGLPYKSFSSNWNDVTKTIYESSNFGGELKKLKHFKNDLERILLNTSTRDEKINAIFNFVKNKIKWNGLSSYLTNKGVKKAYKEGVGNVAEINLTLISMLREAGFDASPILVSTRSNGVPIFPTRNGFNYVICGIELLNQIILLDATEEYSFSNVLPKRVLNWQGRIIRSHGSSAFVPLFPEVYNFENNRLKVKINSDGTIVGSLRTTYKNLKTISFRNQFNKLTKENLINTLEEKYNPVEIEKVRLSNKTEVNKPFLTSFKFSAENQIEEISGKLYFSPLLFLNDKENYFKQDNRKYPVDFASPWLDDFDIIIQIPEGYKVEKLPESTIINAESGNFNFSYASSIKGTNIVLKVTTKVNVPIIAFNAYKELKDFYSAKILKQNEKIVLVKE